MKTSNILRNLVATSVIALAFATPVIIAVPAFASDSVAASVSQSSLPDKSQVNFGSEMIDGVKIAYREAGDPNNPTILLLHGFPTSSHMYRNLIPKLATKYHVIAPDYPGYGASGMPRAENFEYSFAHIADMMTTLIDRKSVDKYAVYLMDYGAPIGYRMFAENPERVSGFIIQNGNAYEEGLQEFWDPLKAYWADGSKENADKLRAFLEIGATKWQFTHGTQNPDNINPDNFWHVQYLLDRPGNQEVQLEMFKSYGTNVGEYPKWQTLFREHQPPTLLMWGKNDHIFPEAGAHPYKRDLKNIEFHILDTGHFALEEFGPQISDRILEFMDRQ